MEGYRLKETIGEPVGLLTDEAQTVTYVYEKNDTKKGADEGNITHT
ncbi:TPA: MucBP domain-containing protein, partial [Enterococcus faecalis]|nr:MucBP domain-containing protein [Enterococcus faecalis]